MIFQYRNNIWLSDFLKIMFISATLIVISKLLQIDIGVNLEDEGFLWYGVKQTLDGYIPIKDFNSYDIARYYWCAFWSPFFGSEIIGLRISISIIQFIGLCFGLYVIRKATSNWVVTLIAGVTLTIWMFPRYKLFETGLSMACIFFGYAVLEYRNRKWVIISGIFVGIAALFGRNYGLYSFLAFSILILVTLLKDGSKNILRFLKEYPYFLAGIIIGYSPMLIMFIVVPDFFDLFLQKIFVHLQGEAKYFTSLPIPIPWFWTIDYSKYNLMKSIYYLLQGILFFIIPVYYFFSFLLIYFNRSNLNSKIYHGLIASGVVGIFYMHHIFSRAGLGHLAVGIFPFLISLILLIYTFNKKARFILFAFILLISLFSVGQRQPYYYKLFRNKKLVSYNINGDNLWIHLRKAKFIRIVEGINDKYVQKDEGLLIASHQAIFYPILNRKCPVYNSYILLPENKQTQLNIIKDLKDNKVNWIILGNKKFDGRDDLRFSNSHKYVYNYIQENYEIIKIEELPKNYYLYHKKK